jgi:hypothetical protein
MCPCPNGEWTVSGREREPKRRCPAASS